MGKSVEVRKARIEKLLSIVIMAAGRGEPIPAGVYKELCGEVSSGGDEAFYSVGVVRMY